MADVGKKLALATLVAGGSVALDQGSKWWAHQALDESAGGHARTVVKGYFDLIYSENPGAAFSLLRDAHLGRILLLTAGSLALLALPIFIARTAWSRKVAIVALSLILGGTLGNFLDRARLGVVTDFIFWHLRSHAWPIFNVADASLVCGVLLFTLFRTSPATAPGPAPGDRRPEVPA